MSKMRLTDKHPFKDRFDELAALTEAMGISIAFFGMRTFVTDTETGKRYELEYIDSPDDAPNCWPPTTECKLTYEKG